MLILAWLFIISIIITILTILLMAFITTKEFKIFSKNILTWLTISVMISSWSAIVCGLLWLGGKLF